MSELKKFTIDLEAGKVSAEALDGDMYFIEEAKSIFDIKVGTSGVVTAQKGQGAKKLRPYSRVEFLSPVDQRITIAFGLGVDYFLMNSNVRFEADNEIIVVPKKGEGSSQVTIVSTSIDEIVSIAENPNRQSLTIQASTENDSPLRVGVGVSVSSSSGFEIDAGDSMTIKENILAVNILFTGSGLRATHAEIEY